MAATADMVTAPLPDPPYGLTTLCSSSAITPPYLIGFANDGPIASSCLGQKANRLFAGTLNIANGKIWQVRQACVSQQLGPTLCAPESILVDQQSRWQSLCTISNLLIVGGCNTISFVIPSNGTICKQFPDSTFAHIGQMALDSTGRLFVGSVDGDSLNVIEGGVVDSFYSASGPSPRAVVIDAADNVYLTCATDGVMRKLAADGTVINASFASGLTGAVSQALAPAGIFHGDLFVACGNRDIEVNLATGASTVFLPCQESMGISFDPDGFMHVSATSQNRILRIGPARPGDMDGDEAVTLIDAPGFAKALLKTPDAPLPMITADMNADGCADSFHFA